MGVGLRIFIVNDDDSLERLALTRYAMFDFCSKDRLV